LISSAASRSSRSALRTPRFIAILYCKASGASVRIPSSPSPPFGPLGFGPRQQKRQQNRQRIAVVLFVDHVHCPPQGGRVAPSRDSPTRCRPSWILTHDLRCKNAREPWSDWTIFFGRIALRKD